MLRTESRGSHRRTDHPKADDAEFLKHGWRPAGSLVSCGGGGRNRSAVRMRSRAGSGSVPAHLLGPPGLHLAGWDGAAAHHEGSFGSPGQEWA